MKRLRNAGLAGLLVPLVSLSVAVGIRAAPKLPITPNPNTCPPATRDVVALVQRATPAVTPVPFPTAVSIAPLPGRPADATLRAEILPTLIALAACDSAARPPLTTDLTTDAYAMRSVAQAAAQSGESPLRAAGQQEAGAQAPRLSTPPPAYWWTLVDVRDVLVLDDGRVSAIALYAVQSHAPGAPPPFAAYIILKHVDGKWRVDEEISGVYFPGITPRYPTPP